MIKRYGAVFATSWKERKQWDTNRYRADEAEFLPAALALQQQAVSPAPRVAMWLLIAFAALAVLWSVFGRVDIVATAQGKIIPSEGTQVVQPIGTASVRAIHVREGQQVRAGQLLVELDGTTTQADRQRIANDLLAWTLQAAHAEAMLRAIDTGVEPEMALIEVPAQTNADAQRFVLGEYAALRAKLAGIDAELASRQAERESVRAMVHKLELTAPIAKQRALALKDLASQEYVARNSYLERERERIEQESDLRVQRSRLKEIDAAIAQVRQQRETALADSRHANLERLTDARERMALLEQDLIKARQSESLTRLAAPVSGTVQQLAIRTVGGVVTEAQPLMLVVPEEHVMEVEAFLENKDVGFVQPGQDAEVKIEAFPYTRYGIVPGKVTSVSDDAIQDEKRGLVYAVRVALSHTSIPVQDSEIRLSPGMAVTAEIKTGRRRVIQYFLGPLIEYGSESLRER
ncbi:HlyD family type I secretion periplasmic adaptor subunit [Bordetella ansorpii]|uniref:HlyD family type I secretion periplasmic adaptor subunit n=1 Tax=Bordetella ansorpii TaxID=288768 RepID=UPI001F421285|nr:HlyD family type I secretion periplasmic adaptor subunit [Bordetella ansorpii]